MLNSDFFRDVTNTRDREGDTTAYEFHDKDGDELTITFTGGELMELVVYSPTGCMVLDKEGALELANAILQEFGEPVTGGEDG